MNESTPAVLVVDDESHTLSLIEQVLADELPVRTASSGREALAVLQQEDVGVVVADQRMPGMAGTELLRRIAEQWPDVVRILLTAYADIETLAEAVNEARIYQFIAKPWENQDLRLTVRSAMETHLLRQRNEHLLAENTRLVEELRRANQELERENVALRQEVHRSHRLDNIITVSPQMKDVLRLVEKAWGSSSSVLITGETGTGKELIARAIHYNGPRRRHRFIAQNCAALPETLLESELFGHRAGAFTGAMRSHQGLFAQADRGTIFLDEIGDMPLSMQAKLLRVLEEGEVRPVGSNETFRVDVRLVSATHHDLPEAIRAGRFRADLYFRLDVFRVHLPPLRERDGDIRVLARHFFEKFNAQAGKELRGITEDALRALEAHPFPGNIRELENEIERAVALANPAGWIDADLLSNQVRASMHSGGATAADGDLRQRMQAFERRLIIDELRRHNRNRTHTAAKLGITVRALQKKINALGIRD